MPHFKGHLQASPRPSLRPVTPYLIVDDGAAAIEYYKKAFGAVERMRTDWDEGKIGHAELTIGNSIVMLANEFPGLGDLSPKTAGSTTVSLLIYTENADEMFARAIAHGATEIRPVADLIYGDRCGTLEDPYGHRWTISTHVEDVSAEELARRSEAMRAQPAQSD